jgi:IS5 family transposase
MPIPNQSTGSVGGAGLAGRHAPVAGIGDREFADPLAAVPNSFTKPSTRIDQWKSRLLDLSLRNRLLNFRETKSTIRILSTLPERVEDELAAEHELSLRPRPKMMTHSRRKPESRKERKRILRGMKKLVKVVGRHARKHRDLLDQEWEKTDWTRRQAELVLGRIDQVLELLPRAQKQAHERIIGERQVANAEKILSLYEPHIQVLVRGKAGAEVEFGNKLLLGENRQGIILDYQLWPESVPADASVLVESLERVVVGLKRKMGAVGSDRGFASKANSGGLAWAEIFDGLCPKSPAVLKERMKEPRFVRMQKRRSQTEGRISILQRGFLGRPMRAKGFAHRELAVAWGVLTHNLWMLARLQREKKEPLRQAA